MKSLRQVKWILVGGFYGEVFITQIIAWAIINHMGALEIPIIHIIGIALLMTLITCSIYLLLRKLYQRVTGDDETILAEDVYEVFRTD